MLGDAGSYWVRIWLGVRLGVRVRARYGGLSDPRPELLTAEPYTTVLVERPAVVYLRGRVGGLSNEEPAP